MPDKIQNLQEQTAALELENEAVAETVENSGLYDSTSSFMKQGEGIPFINTNCIHNASVVIYFYRCTDARRAARLLRGKAITS